MDAVQSRKNQIAPIHDLERLGFQGQFVEDIDVVNLAGGNNDTGRNASPKIQQGMQFDRGFVLSEFGPNEQRQQKIDCRGIKSVGDLLQLDAEILFGIQDGRLLDQDMSKIGENTPDPSFVGIGYGAAGPLSVHPRLLEFGSHGPQTGFDVAQTLPIIELSKRYHQELFVAGQGFDLSVALKPPHALVEFVPRQPVHHLSNNTPSFVHIRVPPE